ncbi:MFS transporter [Geodermatophilus sp. TF02-6]|uniref:sugar porter family MFS transporter n=1 Tax=Geodermatophilus sp. TF02-6 TaxID=2250575 RepID=UPI000DE900E0|nr:sugar porter family MFS transporter [Geodermatophilus sp. TF02-6]RBY83826.1 MFS transporter [Geodermatophilus sp. TF02-6]
MDVSTEGLKKARRAGLFVNLGTFLIGYTTGVIAGALLYIGPDFGLDELQSSLVTTVLLLGAMVGALGSGRVADRRGRKATLLLAAILFTVGLALAAVAPGFWVLLLGRAVMGLGVGTASALVPTYLTELSPTQIRGRMLALNQLMQNVGMLVAYLVNLTFSSSGNWRAMFWVGAIPAVVLALGALKLPESPSWLVAQGRVDDARSTLGEVTGTEGADRVVQRYRREAADDADRSTQDEESEQQGWQALRAPRVRAAVVVGLGLAALQQLVGINTVLYYAPTIMAQTGLTASNSILYSVVIGVVNLLMSFLSLRLIDRVGRRPLLITSLVGMGVSVALLGLAFVADLSPLLKLIGMVLYVMSFAVGMGPVFWALLPEIFPSAYRAQGTSAGSATNWLSNFAVSTAFLPLAGAIGTGPVFLVFAVVCLFALGFVGKYVPETKDRNFAQIDADLRSRWSGQQVQAA